MTCWKAWVHIRLKIKERHQKGRVFPLPFWSWSDRKWFELRVVDELCFPSQAFRPSCLTKGLLTVWPDYFLTFGHLCQWKLSPWHTKFVKASPKSQKGFQIIFISMLHISTFFNRPIPAFFINFHSIHIAIQIQIAKLLLLGFVPGTSGW